MYIINDSNIIDGMYILHNSNGIDGIDVTNFINFF